MRQWINRLFTITLCLAVLGGAWALSAPATVRPSPATGADSFGLERTDGSYYTIVDEQNKPLDYTGHFLSPGDELITADNLRYQITSVKGDVASARLVGKEAAITPVSQAATGSDNKMAGGRRQTIGVYHTHSAESYVPSDGADSNYGQGGIFKVGGVFTDKLKTEGFNALHSLRIHDPHDANAYYRSRRTAVELLNKGSAAIFDVHRDAAPPNVYATVINGQQVTKVKFVLGRGNPRLSANLQFAKELKSSMDTLHPGMIQGILLTSGDFNQDLSPRALLIEAGSHTNDREAAQKGVSLFAEAIPKVLGGATGGKPGIDLPAVNRASWSAVFWILLIAGGGLAAFIYINAGSWQGAWERVRRFFGSELGNRIRGGR